MNWVNRIIRRTDRLRNDSALNEKDRTAKCDWSNILPQSVLRAAKIRVLEWLLAYLEYTPIIAMEDARAFQRLGEWKEITEEVYFLFCFSFFFWTFAGIRGLFVVFLELLS